jgi:hypothetical protein
MLPLDHGVILAALGTDSQGAAVAAPFPMLRTWIPDSPSNRVYVVAAPGSRTAGAAAALHAELKLAADKYARTRAVKLPSTKRDRR